MTASSKQFSIIRRFDFWKRKVLSGKCAWRESCRGKRLVLLSGAGGRRLLVLTTQRLLLFVTNLRDRTLSREYPLGEISAIRMLEPNEMGWFQRLKCFLNPAGWNAADQLQGWEPVVRFRGYPTAGSAYVRVAACSTSSLTFHLAIAGPRNRKEATRRLAGKQSLRCSFPAWGSGCNGAAEPH